MQLKKNYLVPGKQLSVYHFQSALHVQLYNSKGCTYAKYMFCGCCIFVNHASGYIQVWHQVTFSAYEAVNDKFL